MQIEAIVDRVKSIILSPKDTLTASKTETWVISDTIKNYIAIIAAIPPVAQFIGYAIVGLPLIGRLNFFRSLFYAVISYILSIVAVVVVGKVINALAPSFGANKDDSSAFKLAVFCFTPAFVGGIFYLIPTLSVLALLASLYGIYILYIGIPILMEAPQEKTLTYTILTVIISIVIMFLIGAVAGAVAWGTGGPPRYF